MKHDPEERGTVKTSTILIGSGGSFSVYRKIEEVPARLRSRLVKSTAGSNAGTVLIRRTAGARGSCSGPMSKPLRNAEPAVCRRFLAALGEDARGSWEFLRAHWQASALIALVASALLWAIAALRF